MQTPQQVSWKEFHGKIDPTLKDSERLSSQLMDHRVMRKVGTKMLPEYYMSDNSRAVKETVDALTSKIRAIQSEADALSRRALTYGISDDIFAVKVAELNSSINFINDQLSDIKRNIDVHIANHQAIPDEKVDAIQKIAARENPQPAQKPLLTETNIVEPAKQEAPFIPPVIEPVSDAKQAYQQTKNELLIKKFSFDTKTEKELRQIQNLVDNMEYELNRQVLAGERKNYDEAIPVLTEILQGAIDLANSMEPKTEKRSERIKAKAERAAALQDYREARANIFYEGRENKQNFIETISALPKPSQASVSTPEPQQKVTEETQQPPQESQPKAATSQDTEKPKVEAKGPDKPKLTMDMLGSGATKKTSPSTTLEKPKDTAQPAPTTHAASLNETIMKYHAAKNMVLTSQNDTTDDSVRDTFEAVLERLEDIEDEPSKSDSEILKERSQLTTKLYELNSAHLKGDSQKFNQIAKEIGASDKVNEINLIDDKEAANILNEQSSNEAWTIAGLTAAESLAVGAIIGGAILIATGPIGLVAGGALMLGGIIGGAVAGVIGLIKLFGGDENKSAAQPAELHPQQDGPTSDPSIGRKSSYQETVEMAKELKQHINIDMSSQNFGKPETPGMPRHQSLQQHRAELTTQQEASTKTPESDNPPQQLNK